MDYTLEDGRYYKVVDSKGNLIATGELSEGQVLTTKNEVELMTDEEFIAQNEE